MKRVACVIVMLAGAGCSSDPETPPGGQAPSSSGTCSQAREQLLKPIDAVSTGEVAIVSEEGGTRTIYVDASAGGSQASGSNPRLYVDLETATKVDVTDVSATTSTAWDLAIKRPILFTNGGDGGSGQGGALFVSKEFDAVTAADAGSFAPESFFEADCTAKVDPTNAVKTSFDGWYDYDTATNALSPRAGTWLVKGGTGQLYKVQILSYYANPDGSVGEAGGRYTMKVAAL